MLFSSLEFLYLFLPLTAAVYFLCPKRLKNYVLLVASLVFYGIAEPKYLPLMLAVALADYAFGFFAALCVARGREKLADALTAVAVVSNVAVLFAFKYLDAVLALLGLRPIGTELPTGISFYTFQSMSYVIDVRRGAARVQKNPFLFTAYVSLFPQLVAGPIVRYSEIDSSLEERRHSVSRAADGMRLFAVGLAKKMLLANGAGEEWERLARYSLTDGTVIGAWLGLLFFGFQIYFDFSGYSDMACGLGKIFGFDFPENFRYPYTSRSITEFWRRWHITLSSWFREYVYIPLGGNRRGRGRTYLNLLVTWLLTGAWHGASLNFLTWGVYFFAVLAIEKAFLLRRLKALPSAVARFYTVFVILIGWLIFASDGSVLSSADGVRYFGQLFGIGAAFVSNDALRELCRNLPYLCIMAVGATPLPKRVLVRMCRRREDRVSAAGSLLALLSLAICTCYLAASGYNPFLYFKF